MDWLAGRFAKRTAGFTRRQTLRPLGRAGSGVVSDTLAVSPDRRHVAWFERRPGGRFVVHDGRDVRVAGTPWVGPPLLSKDGRLLYGVKSEQGESIVVDGQVLAAHEGTGPATFSPDGRRIAYAALNAGRWRFIVDGEQLPEFKLIAFAIIQGPGFRLKGFTPDSEHFVYVGSEGNENVVMIDSTEVARYTGDMDPEFAATRDGSVLAYAVVVGNQMAVQRNRELLQVYDEVAMPTFSPDGSRFVYTAMRGQQVFLVEAEHESEPFDTVMDNSILFSADGRHLAFAAMVGGRWHVVMDGVRSKPYAGVLDRTSVFSPDGKRFAYAAGLSPDDIEVVVDQEVVGRHPRVGGGSLAFSPDGASFAYSAREKVGCERVMLDGSPGPKYTLAADILPETTEAGVKRYSGGASIIFDTNAAFHYLAVKESNGLLIRGPSTDIYVVEETTGGVPE